MNYRIDSNCGFNEKCFIDDNGKYHDKNEEELISPEEAIELYNEAQKYLNGDGVPVDLNKAAELFVKADIAECPMTKRLFQYDVESKDKKRVLSEQMLAVLEIAAENGYAPAQYVLGMKILVNKKSKDRFERAYYWLNEASLRDHKIAKCHLADLYVSGRGTEKDLDKAFRLYVESANLGYGPAQYKVGEFYEKGIVVEKNPEMAIKCYTDSSKSGYSTANAHLADIYEKGEITEQNLKLAFEYYEKCCNKGIFSGYTAMYRFYSQGIYVEKDEEKAEYWLNKMPKGSNRPDIGKITPEELLERLKSEGELNLYEYYKLGVSYLCGKDIEKDVDKAIFYLKKSDKLGYVIATVKLGEIYESEEFGHHNLEKAFNYYRNAAEKKYEPGLFNLYRFYRLGIYVDPVDEMADAIRTRLSSTYKKKLDQIDAEANRLLHDDEQ